MKLAKELVRGIQSGHYPVGSLLPKEHELAEQFRASRHTVRHAIEHLRQQRLVSSKRGVGTRIENTRAALNFYPQSIEDLFNHAQETRLQPVFRTSVTLEGREAERLGARGQQHWLHLGCLRYVHGEDRPMCWTDIYIDGRLQDLVSSTSVIATPIFPRIEELTGEKLTKIHQQIRAVILSPSLLGRLGTEPPGTALEISRRYAFGDRVLQVSINTFPADRFSYTLDILPVDYSAAEDSLSAALGT